jgi:hypothetical protein
MAESRVEDILTTTINGETYTKFPESRIEALLIELNNLIISSSSKSHFIFVDELPSENIDVNSIYLTPSRIVKDGYKDSTNDLFYVGIPNASGDIVPSSEILDIVNVTLTGQSALWRGTRNGVKGFDIYTGSTEIVTKMYPDYDNIALQINNGNIEIVGTNTRSYLDAGMYTITIYKTTNVPDYAKFDSINGDYIATITGNDAKTIYDAIIAGTYTKAYAEIQWGAIDGTKDEYIYDEDEQKWEKIG